MMRHRPCGCDRRDDITYDQGAFPSSQLCDACTTTPCAYVAQFGCVIYHDGIYLAGPGGGEAGTVPNDAWVAGDVTLRVLCEFENPCVFVSLQSTLYPGTTCWPLGAAHQDVCCTGTQDISHNAQPCVGCNNPGACQWIHRIGSIVGLVTGWEMDISADPVQLTHAAAGVTYEADAAWDCLGKNTMTLTVPFDGALPSKVCVIPKPYELTNGIWDCGRQGLVEQNCCDDAIPCGYSDADRLACCDPCCDQLPDQPLFITCGACSESTTVTPVVGGGNGLDGVDSPSGQTYGACATLCGKEVCGNWYCSSGQWKLDGYVDGDFCGTGDLTHTCCPLTLGTTTLSGCSPSGCDICVGDGCPEGDCCDTAPGTLTMSFTSTCSAINADLGPSVTLTQTGAGEWKGIWYEGQEAVLTCDGAGTWSLFLPILDCSSSTKNATSVTCSPFELTFDNFTVTFDGGSCACTVGDTITVSITA